MLNRRFPTPQPAGTRSATYLVHYPGHAEDLNAWNTHYLTSHPSIMQTFPGIQGIEIYTRVDWIGGLPGPRVDFMQRNKVVFADAQALSATEAELAAEYAGLAIVATPRPQAPPSRPCTMPTTPVVPMPR